MAGATIRDVAKKAGVAVGTVSRVINESANVASAMREKVEQAILELQFEPNAAARSIGRGSSRTIGILISDIVKTRLAELARAAQSILDPAGYDVFIACHDNIRKREDEILRQLTRRRVDGLIRSYCTDVRVDMSDSNLKTNIPTVFYDRDGPANADVVRVAHRQALRQAMEHLIGLGHRRIAIVTGPKSVYPARARLEGYMDAFNAAKIPFDRSLIKVDSFDTAFGNTVQLLEREDRPTAIVLGGAGMLAGALSAIRKLGLRIPEDISLIAGADTELAQLGSPPISALRWDFQEAGRACAKLLLSRLSERNASFKQVLLEPDFVVRESCAPPSTQDSQLRRRRKSVSDSRILSEV